MTSDDLAREAMAAGVTCIYGVPGELEDACFDPLILEAIRRINECGWVVTAESCQGHPDSEDPYIWAGNVEPMLRLVCRSANARFLLEDLAEASRTERYLNGDIAQYALAKRAPSGLGMRVYVGDVPAGWFSVLIYVFAKTTHDRNQGCAAFARLAELVNAHAWTFDAPSKDVIDPAVFKVASSFGHETPEALADHLLEHAHREAGGGCNDPNYDPETLSLEADASRTIKALAAEVRRLRGGAKP